MKIAEALAILAGNIAIKMVLSEGAAAVAIIGTTVVVCVLIGYKIYKTYEFENMEQAKKWATDFSKF